LSHHPASPEHTRWLQHSHQTIAFKGSFSTQ
jgi:hypothetical protein